ncbi:hypothetical protein IOD16_19230 [Saccharothrix sp. 6-C]|uniref:hypothetical protein n=1 Tax=Saccharothrix sp. 6-C TaxID=2781735 RepID=UPI001917126F|nr:hypothetical protein [Saccharothrix sp. 6-C]QQQ73437.1 hypothetical protein IOD16_19230 [Saccharothrix sp. 6-C]
MARQPEVFVRPSEPWQAQRMVKVARSTRDRVRARRAGIVPTSWQGRSVTAIAQLFAASPG